MSKISSRRGVVGGILLLVVAELLVAVGVLSGTLSWSALLVPAVLGLGTALGWAAPVYALAALLGSILVERADISVLSNGALHLRLDEVLGPAIALGILIRYASLGQLMQRLRRVPGLVPLLLFLVASLLITLVTAETISPGNLTRGLSLTIILAAGAACYVAVCLVVEEIGSIREIVVPLLATAAVEVAIGIIALGLGVVLGVQVFGLQTDNGTKLTEPYGTMYEANFFGHYMGAITVLAIALVVGLLISRRFGRSGGWAILLVGLLAGVALILSLTRTAWLACAVGVVVVVATSGAAQIARRNRRIANSSSQPTLEKRRGNYAPSLCLLVALGLAVLVCGMALALVEQGFVSGSAAVVNSPTARANTLLDLQNGSGVGRAYMTSLVLDDWKRSPIFGLGAGSFNIYMEFQTTQPWIYSMFLAILHDTGIIGIVLFFWFLVAISWPVWKALRSAQDPQAQWTILGFAGAAFTLVAAAQGTSSFILMFLWVFLGLAAAVPGLVQRLTTAQMPLGPRNAQGACSDAEPRLAPPAVGAGTVNSLVTHIIDSSAIGGGPRALLAMARGLHAFGWTSTVICGNDGPLAQDLADIGVPVESLAIAGQYRFLTRLPMLMFRLRQLRPAAVIVYGPIAGCLGGVSARIVGVPRIAYSAGYPSYYADFDWRRRLRNAAVERIACACADVVWCKSTTDRQLYIDRKATRPEKLHVMPNSVSNDIVRSIDQHLIERAGTPRGAVANVDGSIVALRQQLGFAPTETVIGYIGRLVPEKGVDILLRATPTILQAMPNAHILIVGDGPERVGLEQFTRDQGIAGHVTFVGARHDIVSYYLLTDVVVAPSRYEPFGNVAIEAMAAGRPVVASRVGGFIDTVIDGSCGKLFDPGQPDALAAAVQWVLQSPAHTQELGANGRRRALAEYTEEQMAARMNRVLYPQMTERTEPEGDYQESRRDVSAAPSR